MNQVEGESICLGKDKPSVERVKRVDLLSVGQTEKEQVRCLSGRRFIHEFT